MNYKVLGVAIATLLTGCATRYSPVPDGYTGPLVQLTDSVRTEDWSKAQIFAVVEIDGRPVDNSFNVSANASYGKGMALTALEHTRQVVPRPMTVKLRGSHATAAPIHEIASKMAGTFYSVEGTVSFEPQPDKFYVVRGELSKQRSSVWIEEGSAGVVVTRKVTSP